MVGRTRSKKIIWLINVKISVLILKKKDAKVRLQKYLVKIKCEKIIQLLINKIFITSDTTKIQKTISFRVIVGEYIALFALILIF